jgi:A/G-specific adenine glycosylase
MRPEPPSPAAPPPAAVRDLRAKLLRWYRRSKRDLPWRRTRDPYAVWISEVMLQQTRVAAVLPYYERFLARFPDVAALARADEEQVLALWSGLGYYRRARALHAGARAVMERHAGELPGDPGALRDLPGIGRYTAGAIASIAFDRPEPVLDGNVRRVLSRLLALRDAGDSTLWALARTLVAGPHPGDLNQALMELGAIVCTPRGPRCDLCPLRRACKARASGDPESVPARREAAPPVTVRVAVAWIPRGGRVLLQRSGNGPLRGAWDLPAIEVRRGEKVESALRRRLAGRALEIEVGPRRARLAHAIMNRRLVIEVHRCRLLRGRVASAPDLRWHDPAGLGSVAISGATRKIARALQSGSPPRSSTRAASR